MSRNIDRRRFCLALCGAAVLPLAARAQSDIKVSAEVRQDGDVYFIDIRAHSVAPPMEAWSVLTDFDHMTHFLPNLTQSQVTARNGQLLTVTQKGEAQIAGMSFPFETVRQVELKPYDVIRTRLLSGNMKKMVSTTTLHPDTGGSFIQLHAEAEPDFWVPPLVGPSVMRRQLESQFTAMLAEIQRRHG